jgi:inosine-uridine nucleoside N-ribohydrolase
MKVARKIIIDTDPGVDDAMAIFYALASPELDVIALTTIFGNAHTDVCTRNALGLLEIAGRPDIPVARGANQPLVFPFRGPADYVHGEFGQGHIKLPDPSIRAVDHTAAELMVDLVMASPGAITLVPIGPLTNVALAMQLEPAFTDNLNAIVLMGGNAFTGGNASPAAEANIYNDPEAADIVFGAQCDIVMAGLDVTESIVMTSDELAQLSAISNPRAQHLAAIIPFYRDFYRDRVGLDGIHVHDSTAISYLIAPELFGWKEQPIRVDTGTSFCRGKTQPAKRISDSELPWADRRPVRILTEVDATGVVALEMDRLQR